MEASGQFSEKEVAGAQAALDNIKEHREINGGESLLSGADGDTSSASSLSFRGFAPLISTLITK